MNLPFDLGYEVFVVPAAWLALLVTVSVLLIRKKWRVAALSLGIGAMVLASLVVTPPGHRGVIYSAVSGVSVDERSEGVSLMLPILQSANMMSVREQKYINEEVYAQTADLLEVTVQIGVNYYVEPGQAAELFRDVGKSYEIALIEPAVLDISKRRIGLIDAIDFPTNRQSLSDAIRGDLAARLGNRGINVTFVAIQDNIFDPTFVGAVLNKEVADEKAEEAERLVEVAKHEAQQAIERAEGEAEALLVKAEAKRQEQQLLGMSSTEYVWFTTWNGQLPQTLLGDGQFIVSLPN